MILEHGILRFAIAAIALLPAARGGLAQQVESSWQVAKTVVVDPEVWRWNWASWDQDKIATVGDYQYTVFWDADRVFVLARRDLRDDRIQTLRLPNMTLSSDDPHRNTCLGVSLADGRLHLSWDHHNNPLRYTRSRAGFLSDPPQQMRAEDIETPQPLSDHAAVLSRATYPRFLNDAQGRLLLFYRQGGSGNGDNYLFAYDPNSGAWTGLGKAFSSRGKYEPWDGGTSRNAYFHDLLFDRQNRLHATWVYREISATWASNHDLHYAYSDDGGRTWRNNGGQPVADLQAGDPVELGDPGIVVREIPVFSWIMNAGCMALDSQNRPHVVTYKLPEPQRVERVQHNPPAPILDRLRFVHYWRADDGRWLGGEPIEAGADGGRVARGNMVFDARDTLYFMYQPRQSEGGFVCLEAAADDGWAKWRSYPLTASGFGGMDASKHDRRRWTENKVLSFSGRTGSSDFAIIDLTLPQP